jgi:hypothetical protein
VASAAVGGCDEDIRWLCARQGVLCMGSTRARAARPTGDISCT